MLWLLQHVSESLNMQPSDTTTLLLNFCKTGMGGPMLTGVQKPYFVLACIPCEDVVLLLYLT